MAQLHERYDDDDDDDDDGSHTCIPDFVLMREGISKIDNGTHFLLHSFHKNILLYISMHDEIFSFPVTFYKIVLF